MKNFSFIIAAGGQGKRFGGKKQFMTLGGRELWRWSAENAATLSDSIREIVLVIPQGDSMTPKWHNDIPIRVVNGGSERAVSVLNGLNMAECDYVMVHDAARPFASPELFRRLMYSVSDNAGVIPVLPVSDALKRIDDDGKISSVDRDRLYITQTPQVFPRLKLIEAVKDYPSAKDEAEAWLKSGHVLRYVDGERMNFKATVKDDMTLARALTENRIVRTGLGWDIHRLVPDRKLILGGVRIESPLGLLGHSDADVLTHALMDAILGGAGLPDIGNIFPASDEKFKGADSIELLREVMRLVTAEGWNVEFVDAVITAQVPRLNKYREEIMRNLSQFFPVNIKFKSAENIDDSGRGLCITCHAAATLGKVIESC